MIKPFESVIKVETDILNPSIFDLLKLMQKGMQDASITHADEIGYGAEKMNSYNAFWAIARLRVKIHKSLVNHHTYRILTWPNPYDAIGIDRNYQIYNEFNDLVITGMGKWVIINKLTYNLIKPINFELTKNHLFAPVEKTIPEGYLRQLSSDLTKKIKIDRRVSSSEIDQNGHVNNVVYLDYIQNAYFEVKRKNVDISEYQINYSESLFDAELFTMDITETAEGARIQAKRNSDNKLIFSSIIISS